MFKFLLILLLFYNIFSFLLNKCLLYDNTFEYNEIIEKNILKRTISFNSCSNHFNLCQESECGGNNVIKSYKTNFYYEIPLFPVINQRKKDTTCLNGTIGIALNGVSIESMSHIKPICVKPEISGQSSNDKACNLNGINDGTKFCGDAVQSDGKSFDKCGGHVNEFGVYHYHVAPICLIQQLTEKGPSLPFNHNPQIGWALDGFPIYGQIGPLGTPILSCSNPLSDPTFCLDECNGLYFSLPDIDQYMYRYYMTGPISSGECSKKIINAGTCDRIDDPCCLNILPTIHDRPYSIGCFRGCLVDQTDCVIDDRYPGVNENFSPKISSFPTEVFRSSSNKNNQLNESSSSPPPPPIHSNLTNITHPIDNNNNETENNRNFYSGYGSTIVRFNQTTRSIGKIEVIPNDQNLNKNDVRVEEFVQSGDEAYITGLLLTEKHDDEENE